MYELKNCVENNNKDMSINIKHINKYKNPGDFW